MKVIQKKDGSGEMIFTFKERLFILLKGKVIFSDESLRHFGNALMKMVIDWQHNFSENTKNLNTSFDQKIKLD